MLYAVTALLLSPTPVGVVHEALPVVPPVAGSGVTLLLERTDSIAQSVERASEPIADEAMVLDQPAISPSSLAGTAADVASVISATPARPAVDLQPATAVPPAPAAAPSVAAPAALGPIAAQAVPASGTAPEGRITAAALIGPVVAADPAALPRMEGVALLRQFAVQPRSELARFFASNATSVQALLASPPSPSAVTAWWESVPPAAKHTISRSAPTLVGNLNGIPFADRSAANRSLLTDSLVRLESQLNAQRGRAELGETVRRVEALKDIRGALGDQNSEPQRYLLSLDLDREPTAAIAVGDPQRADYVSVLIPGMFFNSGAQISEWTDTAARLYDEQVSWLQLLGTDGNKARETVAAIAWVGYQTPHLLNVGSLDLAREGRDALTGMVEGLQSSRGMDQPFLSILAHSYGSTAALMALEENDFEVDALAVIGSPGSAAQSVDELNVRNGNVFVGEAAWDPIPNSSYFGSDPGAEGYGANRMNVGGGIDVITNEVLAASNGHNEYFGPGTESIRNLALIAIDQEQLVTDGTEKDQERTRELAR